MPMANPHCGSHGQFLFAELAGIAAALEEETIPVDELAFELANLDAGFRFTNEENRWKGRIPIACRERFGDTKLPVI